MVVGETTSGCSPTQMWGCVSKEEQAKLPYDTRRRNSFNCSKGEGSAVFFFSFLFFGSVYPHSVHREVTEGGKKNGKKKRQALMCARTSTHPNTRNKERTTGETPPENSCQGKQLTVAERTTQGNGGKKRRVGGPGMIYIRYISPCLHHTIEGSIKFRLIWAGVASVGLASDEGHISFFFLLRLLWVLSLPPEAAKGAMDDGGPA